MELEILQDTTNNLLDRRELTIKIGNTPITPSRAMLKEQVAAKYAADKDTVVIKKINTEFGKQETITEARIYTDAAKAAAIESKHVLERDKKNLEKQQAPKTEETPAEE